MSDIIVKILENFSFGWLERHFHASLRRFVTKLALQTFCLGPTQPKPLRLEALFSNL